MDANVCQKPEFSLAEITVALAILALSVILVAAAFPVGMDLHRRMTEASIVSCGNARCLADPVSLHACAR